MSKLTSEEQGHIEKAVRRHEEDLENYFKALPEHCRGSVRDYVLYGIGFGNFLGKVFENDLSGAALAADDTNIRYLAEYARLLHNAPRDCWGSKEKVDDWIQSDGLKGVYTRMITKRSTVVVDDEVRDFGGRRVDDEGFVSVHDAEAREELDEEA